MSSISNVTSFPCKRKVECEVVGSRPTGCKCNLLIEKKLTQFAYKLAITFDRETKKDHGQCKPSIIGNFMNI